MFSMGVAEVFLLVFGAAGAGVPLGVPPVEDPMMARVAPPECWFYASWAGAGEPDPKSPNHTEQLLAEPEVQRLITELEQQIRGWSSKIGQPVPRRAPTKSLKYPSGKVPKAPASEERAEPGPADRETAEFVQDAMLWAKSLLLRPTAVFVSDVKIGPRGPDIHGGLIVNLGNEVLAIRESLEKYQKKLPAKAVEEVQIDGGTWYRIQPPEPDAPLFVWGTKGRYLIAGIGEGSVEEILKRARGAAAAPAWLAELNKQLPVERRCSVGYVNVKAIAALALEKSPPEARRIVDSLGLSNVTSIAAVSGLDETRYVSKTLIGLDGEPKGVLTAFSGKPLGAKELAVIPRDATFALAVRLDADKLLQTILEIAAEIDPRAGRDLTEGMKEMREATGLDLREDILQALGDTWCVYNAPSEGGFLFTGTTVVAQLRDAPRAKKSMERLVELMRESMRGEGRYGPQSAKVLDFEFAGQKIYYLRVREEEFPFAPAWCVTNKELIISLFPQNIKAFLGRGADFVSLAENKTVNTLIQGGEGPVALAYIDAPELFKLVYPGLQIGAKYLSTALADEGMELDMSLLPSAPAIGRHLAPAVTAVRRTGAGIEVVSHQTVPGGNFVTTLPMTVALLLPAVQSARAAAQRSQGMNNLKQIGLAIHNYNDVFKCFPPSSRASKSDKNAKQLLSWRVHILPYIEQGPLYQQFHLDEPWDSENNKKLIPMMPTVYRSPAGFGGPGMTNYLAVCGPNMAFEKEKDTTFADFTDGTSNTIMVVESARTVIWTKPDDFEPTEENPMRGLLGLYPGGFNALFTDGSVRFISAGADYDVLWNAFVRNDGNPLNHEALDRKPGGKTTRAIKRPTSTVPKEFKVEQKEEAKTVEKTVVEPREMEKKPEFDPTEKTPEEPRPVPAPRFEEKKVDSSAPKARPKVIIEE